MNREQFISALRKELDGLAPQEQTEILADYEEYFRDAVAAGRSEDDVAAKLGQPHQLARELRAESHIKRWEDKRSPANFARLLLAVAGLGMINLLLLLPLFVVGMVIFVFFVAALALLIIGGIMLLANLPGMAEVLTFPVVEIDGISGGDVVVGVIFLLIGGLWLWFDVWVSKWLAVGLIHYARLNYRVIRGES